MDPQSEDWHWTNEREPFLNVRWPVFKRDPQGECHAYHQCTYSVSDCPLTSRKRARDDPPNGGCRSENRKEEWEGQSPQFLVRDSVHQRCTVIRARSTGRRNTIQSVD